MEQTRLKMRVGSHEFEAEGPPEIVQLQLEAFRALIAETPMQGPPRAEPVAEASPSEDSQTVPGVTSQLRLEKIMHADGRVISLTALPGTVEEAALLVMLGQKELRNNVSVTGQEIGDGLDQSGKPANRVDRIMEKHIRDAQVLKTGLGRATRYRLTNQGLTKSLGIARELLASLP